MIKFFIRLYACGLYKAIGTEDNNKMEGIASRRLVKDYELLRKNAEELNNRGIYFSINPDNLFQCFVLIVPKEKKEGPLISPYTSGFFMFAFTFANDFPLTPPSIAFHPQQNYCRLHPNYYTMGKVCLSVINTWSRDDWSPSTSVYNLINILEERFNENALCFEPAFSEASDEEKMLYNKTVEYAKYKVCIMDILKSPLFMTHFSDQIKSELKANKEYLLKRLDELIRQYGDSPPSQQQVCYLHHIHCKYGDTKSKMMKFYQDLEASA